MLIAMLIAILIALIIILSIIMIILFISNYHTKETFVSQKAQKIYNQTRQFMTSPPLTYTKYKNIVSEADPILYSDIIKLIQYDSLSPNTVQSII